MLTLYTVPKPFRGHIGDIQRNAIASWRALDPDIQVVLVGDEDGVAEAAREAGVEHVGALTRNERGTPRLDSAFERVETVARHPLRCFVNADIVLLDDFLPAVERVRRRFESFLMVGESRDLRVEAGAPLGDPRYRNELRQRALADGRLRGYAALDYFVFPKGQFGDSAAVSDRPCVLRQLARVARSAATARSWMQRGQSSRSTSRTTTRTSPGGLEEAYYGAEAKHNEQLAGGRAYIYSLHDATHRLTRNGHAYRYWGSTFSSARASA